MGEADIELLNVGIGDAAGIAAIARELAIGLRSYDGRRCRLLPRHRHKDAAVRFSHFDREIPVNQCPVRRRDLAAGSRGSNARGRRGVEYRLFHRERGPEVVHGIGMVEGTDCEVVRGKLPLAEQGTEHEDRLIAPLPRFREVHPWEVASAGLGNALGRLGLGGCRRTCIEILRAGTGDGFG